METTKNRSTENLVAIRTQSRNSMSGIAHRMESVRVINGLEWINDSKSTDLETALYSFEEAAEKSLWIMGADHDEMNYKNLTEFFPENVTRVIICGSASSECEAALNEVGVRFDCAQSLEEAVELAKGFSIEVTTVLFSPATPGFDEYSNFRERGAHFRSIVKSL